jgi:hypothetical protein
MENRSDFRSRLGERAPRARRVFDKHARSPVRHLRDRMHDREGNPLRRGLPIVIRGRARMKTDRADSKRRRTLQLFREPSPRPRRLLFIRRRRVQHVCGMGHHEPRIDADFAKRGTKTLDPLGLDRALVAVVLRHGGE